MDARRIQTEGSKSQSVDGKTNRGIKLRTQTDKLEGHFEGEKNISFTVFIPWVEKQRQVKQGKEKNTAEV